MIYLLHFSKPVCPWRPARHYIGSTNDLEIRFYMHCTGRGAKITRAAVQRNIDLTVARTWEGGRAEERKLKRQKNAPRLCPICSRIKSWP